VHDPPLVVADEPTAHLDHIQVEGILQLLRELAAPGRLVVVSTHDDRITHIADRVVEMVPHLDTADREPEEIELAPGEILFQQGDRGDMVYVVERGSLEVFRVHGDGTEEHIAVVAKGEYVGELGPMLNLPRSASVRARESSRVTGLTVRRFRARFPATVKDARLPADPAPTPT
jgi:putative ABC transport system ATP-binding protein